MNHSPEFTQYLSTLPEERQLAMGRLIETIRANIPRGFEEAISYGMPGWVVPHTHYAAGYHVDPTLPLPFVSLGSQKNHIGLYHMGIYASPRLKDWFVQAYKTHSKTRLDIGKSCIRFKNVNNIPDDLVGQLCSRVTVEDWVELYESGIKPA